MRQKLVRFFACPVNEGMMTVGEIENDVNKKGKGLIHFKHPSYFPKLNDRLEIFGINHDYQLSLTSGDFIRIAHRKHLLFSGGAVLPIIMKLDEKSNFLPNGVIFFSVDYQDNLNYKDNYGHVIPGFEKKSKGKYAPVVYPWDYDFNQTEINPKQKLIVFVGK